MRAFSFEQCIFVSTLKKIDLALRIEFVKG